MAEINTDGGSKKKGGKKQLKKMSTRIDLTPMVDLGFLLITFFMLTTTLAKPKTMEINMPAKDKTVDSTKISEKIAMTVILSENNKIYYYFGIPKVDETLDLQATNFSKEGIRKILQERNYPQIEKINALRKRFNAKELTEEQYKKQAGEVKAHKEALMVLIKADDKAKYKNLVDILDEMQINSIGKYAIVDVSPVELEMISKL